MNFLFALQVSLLWCDVCFVWEAHGLDFISVTLPVCNVDAYR